MQERSLRIIFSSAAIIQVLAAIWWASALNSTVNIQKATVDKFSTSVEVMSTKVALLELRVGNLEELQRETRDLLKRDRL
jgi:hypothetical protein